MKVRSFIKEKPSFFVDLILGPTVGSQVGFCLSSPMHLVSWWGTVGLLGTCPVGHLFLRKRRKAPSLGFLLVPCLARAPSKQLAVDLYLPNHAGGIHSRLWFVVGQLSVHRDKFKRGIPCRCRQAGGGTKPLGRPYLIGTSIAKSDFSKPRSSSTTGNWRRAQATTKSK